MDVGSFTTLYYERPATRWEEALPIGNGQIGAMVFGGGGQERLALNEKSLWSGGPQDADNPEALPALGRIRQLLFAGRYAEAQELTRRTQVCKGRGSHGGAAPRADYGCYQGLGDLLLDFAELPASVTGYRRQLELDEGVASVSFSAGGAHVVREAFASAPDQVLVVRLTREAPGTLDFAVRLERSECARTAPDGDNGLLMSGQLVRGGEQAGMRFVARLLVVTSGGEVRASGDALRVTGAGSATLLLSAATDHRDGAFERRSADRLGAVAAIPYEDLRRRHVEDHRRLFRRVSVRLGALERSERPTDERLARVAAGEDDPGLFALYAQFGRYLLIASSRPGALPANLQGIWAVGTQTPWNGDYHTNINLQMNYWLAETANLGECAEPLFELIDRMRAPGRRTAKVHYGARGWVVHTLHNVWGYTSPGEEPSWGLSPLAGAWLCQHLWEHFAFGRDIEYLRRVYPIMTESAEFCLDWTVPHPETGRLVSGPATSPENSFIAPGGQPCAISMAPSMDQQILWNLFTDVLDAASAMHVDDDFVGQVRSARDRLAMPEIGSDGRLLEWAEELGETEPHHRHVSHLFALHPGRQITPSTTPDLAEAARKTLVARGDEGTGWSMAWKVCFWARLGDGEHARTLLGNLVYPCEARPSGAGVYPNLFCAHPPFQIDGNLGGAAGIIEMLLQSHDGAITLLPALPRSWASGRATGLRARGGFEVDISWTDRELTEAEVRASADGPCALRYRGRRLRRSLKAGEHWRVSRSFDEA